MALPSGRAIGPFAIAFCGLVCAAPVLALDTKLIESGFSSPIFMTAPEGDSRLFVVERAGVIKVRDGGVWSTFLDIRSQVDPTGERGLLGLAFDPNYQTNNTFYVNYVDSTPAHNTQIARFTATGNVANTVGTPILSIAQPPGLAITKPAGSAFAPEKTTTSTSPPAMAAGATIFARTQRSITTRRTRIACSERSCESMCIRAIPTSPTRRPTAIRFRAAVTQR